MIAVVITFGIWVYASCRLADSILNIKTDMFAWFCCGTWTALCFAGTMALL